MPKVFTSEKQKIGAKGEEIAVMFLMKQGFSIVERNYTKKWGEIDIIAEKGKMLYFIEVKAVTREITKRKAEECFPERGKAIKDKVDFYRPEDNIHLWKLKRLSRTIQTYLLQRKVSDDREWQFDVLVVYMDMSKRLARVKRYEDIVL